jgi:small subunit ribosomal protein S6
MLKKYDGLFIFAGAVKDEALEKVVEKASAEITRLGGHVESTDTFGRRTFARPMKKRDNGVYVKIRFQLDTDKVDALRARYRMSEDVFRVQVLVRDEILDAAKAADHARRSAYRAVAEAAAAAAAAASPAAAAFGNDDRAQ